VGLKRRRYIMRSIKRPTNPIAVPLSVAIVIVLGLAIFTPIAQAEQPFDITLCGSTTVTAILVESEELRITTFEGKGIARSNLESKAFNNYSYQLLGVAHYTGRKATMYGHTKFMDPDGDIVVQENSSPFGATGGTWKFIYGTGKWKGIKGSGKALRVATGKRITPDTLQSCIRMTGTFELPK
jgi:hypothetical protein